MLRHHPEANSATNRYVVVLGVQNIVTKRRHANHTAAIGDNFTIVQGFGACVDFDIHPFAPYSDSSVGNPWMTSPPALSG